MGLLTGVMNGYVFWDVRTRPPFCQPASRDGNRVCVEYRYDSTGSRQTQCWQGVAARGAMYPWSAGLAWKKHRHGCTERSVEHHDNTACGWLAFVAWNYYCASQDANWLKWKRMVYTENKRAGLTASRGERKWSHWPWISNMRRRWMGRECRQQCFYSTLQQKPIRYMPPSCKANRLVPDADWMNVANNTSHFGKCLPAQAAAGGAIRCTSGTCCLQGRRYQTGWCEFVGLSF